MFLTYEAADCYPLRRTPAHNIFVRLHEQLCNNDAFHTATLHQTKGMPTNKGSLLSPVQSLRMLKIKDNEDVRPSPHAGS